MDQQDSNGGKALISDVPESAHFVISCDEATVGGSNEQGLAARVTISDDTNKWEVLAQTDSAQDIGVARDLAFVTVLKADLLKRVTGLIENLRQAPPFRSGVKIFHMLPEFLVAISVPQDPTSDVDLHEHLEKLKAMSCQMSRWQEDIKIPKQKEYPAEVMQEVGAAMQADLTRRLARLHTLCSGLDSAKRGYVFQLSPPLREFILTTLSTDVNAHNVVQVREHLEQLKAVSRHIHLCEHRFEELSVLV